MSVGPRIIFTRFVNGDSPKLQPWASHRDRVIASSAITGVASLEDLREGAIVWHLVSGNNRQLARGARIHATFESATLGATAAVALAPQLDIVYVSERHRGVYGWFATKNNEPVITSSRWYDTERDRARSIGLAMPSLAAAVLLSGAREVDPMLMRSDLQL